MDRLEKVVWTIVRLELDVNHIGQIGKSGTTCLENDPFHPQEDPPQSQPPQVQFGAPLRDWHFSSSFALSSTFQEVGKYLFVLLWHEVLSTNIPLDLVHLCVHLRCIQCLSTKNQRSLFKTRLQICHRPMTIRPALSQPCLRTIHGCLDATAGLPRAVEDL